MMTLGNYKHDFPRIAKESGYFFQLYRGRVNWSEIENLNIEDIIENRNFQLLEQSLLNVVNCNLERDYDLKILDQNFVKLFKLAQLGVDYLSYCELYLDRCVILLQEQLVALQKDHEALRQETQKKSEELKTNKKKSKIQNYKCDKCEKIFISEVYLKCHDKRRHSNPNTPKNTELSPKTFVCKCLETEDMRKLSAATQTDANENENKKRETEEMIKVKKENDAKIDNLEKELEDLKCRLEKAETALLEKGETPHPSSPNYPAPIFYPPLLPYPSSYLRPVTFSIPEYQSVSSFIPVNPEVVISKLPSDCSPSAVDESIKPGGKERESESMREIKTVEAPPTIERVHATKNKFVKVRKKQECDKENVDPNQGEVMASPAKPLPLPRKIKKAFQTNIDEVTLVEPLGSNESIVSPVGSKPFVSITRSSTPVKEKPEAGERGNLKEEQWEMKSNESLIVEEDTVSSNQKQKSFIGKIMRKNSPNFHEFGKSLKKSLTNLYDSVSSSGKDSLAGKDLGNDSNVVVEKLNSTLKSLGVDPDWSGIPKKAMKQKLKALKHRRKFLAKENPMYPLMRKNVEKNIFKKLRERKWVSRKDSNEQESIETQASSFTSHESWTSQMNQKNQKGSAYDKPKMYDVESDLETDESGSEKPETEKAVIEKEAGNATGPVGAEGSTDEFDFSVFQVEQRKQVFEPEVNELKADSDFSIDSFKNESFKTLVRNSGMNGRTEKRDLLEMENSETERDEAKSILKSCQGSQTHSEFVNKKKVLFADVSKSRGNDLWLMGSDED